MNWTALISELAESSPFFIFTLAILTMLAGKLSEYFIKSKKLYMDTNQETVSTIFKRLTLIQDKCNELETELEVWREKYYSLKKDLEILEIENKKLIEKLTKYESENQCEENS